METKADWLRSEIEKLKSHIVGEVLMDMEGTTNRAFDEGSNQALTSIITRYKKELEVLEHHTDPDGAELCHECMKTVEDGCIVYTSGHCPKHSKKEELKVLESK